MKNYKYQLDKSSKKFICPNCGKKTFVKYVDNETNQYIDDIHGRCDREQKCKYFHKPSGNSTYTYNYVDVKPIKPSYITLNHQNNSLSNYEINPLANYLFTKFDENNVRNILSKYKVGTSKWSNGSTVYWQTDNSGNIRSGKVIPYDLKTGKRRKKSDGKSLISWAHNLLKIENYNLEQCLFGLHLLNNEIKRIGIVESEKTAVVLSLSLPNITWMATGSLLGFKDALLKPIKNNDIVAFPDNGGYDNWKQQANKLNKEGYQIVVSDILENNQYHSGIDLADLILETKNKSQKER